MELVIIESPFGGTDEQIERNIRYARAAVKDCLLKGEAPFASHLIYTQEGILDDRKHEDRVLGIEAGLCWGSKASKTVVYQDLGISSGMQTRITRAKVQGRKIEYRSLDEWKEKK